MIPDAWSALRGQALSGTPDAGLLNHTLLVGQPPRFVLQRVNAIFKPTVHVDIEAVTAHLAACGLPTPRLIRTDAGALCAQSGDEVWRVLSFVPGRTIHRVQDPAVAFEAGSLVARFHAATDTLDWDYQHVRAAAHDTHAHMAKLAALSADAEVAPLRDAILEFWARWQGPLDLPLRHAHGDLKISNLRLGVDGALGCLLDLDTLSRLSIDVELGDALRSWCNPVGEDSVHTHFDGDLYAAAIAGYQSQRVLSADELVAVRFGTERITIELASRFCRDAIEDTYFGWDPKRFASRRAHNLYRAWGQLNLARSLRSQG